MRITINVHDAGWDESQHKRDHGKFSSSGGGAGKPDPGPQTIKQAKPHGMVQDFYNRFRTIPAQKEYVSSLPSEKLHVALRLIKGSGSEDVFSNGLKKLLEKELDSRANSGR